MRKIFKKFVCITFISFGFSSGALSEETTVTLPNDDAFELIEDDYVVTDERCMITTDRDMSETVKIVLSEEDELILEIISNDGLKKEAYRILIGDYNPFNLDVKIELADINKDGVKDELLIWWGTMNMSNGFMSGYEMERGGLIIFEIAYRSTILNICTLDSYASYSADENADTDSEDFHGKSDDDSIWEICSFDLDLAFENGEIIISAANIQKENFEECNPTNYFIGSYHYDDKIGRFTVFH